MLPSGPDALPGKQCRASVFPWPGPGPGAHIATPLPARPFVEGPRPDAPVARQSRAPPGSTAAITPWPGSDLLSDRTTRPADHGPRCDAVPTAPGHPVPEWRPRSCVAPAPGRPGREAIAPPGQGTRGQVPPGTGPGETTRRSA